jgi:hypothetical protein
MTESRRPGRRYKYSCCRAHLAYLPSSLSTSRIGYPAEAAEYQKRVFITLTNSIDKIIRSMLAHISPSLCIPTIPCVFGSNFPCHITSHVFVAAVRPTTRLGFPDQTKPHRSLTSFATRYASSCLAFIISQDNLKLLAIETLPSIYLALHHQS